MLFIVALGAGFVYLQRDYLGVQLHNAVYGAPCSRPETYSIGDLDTRFGLSEADARAIIDRAAQAWDTAAGKDLLEYKAQGGDVTVNFRYDRRQAVTVKLSALDSALSENTAAYTAQKGQYDSMSAQLAQMKADLDAGEAAYAQELDQYNAAVRSWNARGGAPRSVRDELSAERQKLAAERADLQQQVDAVNALVQQINATAAQLNAMVKDTNAAVSTYNNLSASTGPEFKEGEYISDGEHKEIDVYQYSNMDKLVRVLEHEFGHSLGLQHVTDKEAIMYPLNEGSPTTPTAADLAELDRACGGQS